MLHLYLPHDFYNIISKINHKFYIDSDSAAPLPPIQFKKSARASANLPKLS